MLEFQEGFFEQEIRDGFYLDTTMKTLWAAELEVLQKVAEICDRHGLKWYAAYGTLLGAVRHEGFVPWDDDMDIWVKRPDYNKLMRILPKELPEGYLVRSPQTDEGYDQFHTCLNNGSGVSVSPAWLEQYHGCPFTVGLDIFPLDYLPRNRKDRMLQQELFTMAARIAQLAKNVGRGDYDDVEGASEKKEMDDRGKEVSEQRKSVINEIKLGIRYIEKNCKLHIDHHLIRTGEWDRVSSELWRWANYLAMMYNESESDHLVEYLDYIQRPYKIYPKKWFEDGYSASFEGFMLPIPAGYEQILYYIYGDYDVIERKTGTHEYPFYARQMRQLREYVRNLQQRAQDVGLVAIDEINVKEETKELLSEWHPLIRKKDGTRKLIVLSANDPAVYVIYGERALDKLEETLHMFEQKKDSVLLWWRPQPVMKKVLDQTSAALGRRYQKILERYEAAGWGICDQTDNTDRAVAWCDVYFGDMNAVLQPFQDVGKPVMIMQVKPETSGMLNRKRYEESRIHFSLMDLAEDKDRIYFSNWEFNALVTINKETGEVEKMIPFEGTRLERRMQHRKCIKVGNKLFFLPMEGKVIHIYDTVGGEQRKMALTGEFVIPKYAFMDSHIWGNRVYFLPGTAEMGLWSSDEAGNQLRKEAWWNIAAGNNRLMHGDMHASRFLTVEGETNRLFITDLNTKEITMYQLPDEVVYKAVYDGTAFWYIHYGNENVVKWTPEEGEQKRYTTSLWGSDWKSARNSLPYGNICSAGGEIFLLSENEQELYWMNRSEDVFEKVEIEEDLIGCNMLDKRIDLIALEDELAIVHRKAKRITIIHPRTKKIRREIQIAMSKDLETGYFDRLLLASHPLLIEEQEKWTPENYINLSMEVCGNAADNGSNSLL